MILMIKAFVKKESDDLQIDNAFFIQSIVVWLELEPYIRTIL